MRRMVVCLITALWMFAGGIAQAAGPTLEEMAGAMLMIGFRGTVPPSYVQEALERDLVGGVILFDRDSRREGERNISSPGQVRQLTAMLQAHAKRPLLIAVDQEGGRVARLRESSGFLLLPSAATLGTLDVRQTRDYARRTGNELKALGINVNLAPVVDLQRAKPSPGLGSATLDSHDALPDVTNSWSEEELSPYRDAFASRWPGMVLVGHVFNRHLDPVLPASLSPRVIEGLLRGQLGFTGVVISDDLGMGAVSAVYSLEERIRLAVLAGNDILLFCNNGKEDYDPALAGRAHAALVGLVRQGMIAPERLQVSWDRLTRLKAQLASSGK